jgi:hypothetical protein
MMAASEGQLPEDSSLDSAAASGSVSGDDKDRQAGQAPAVEDGEGGEGGGKGSDGKGDKAKGDKAKATPVFTRPLAGVCVSALAAAALMAVLGMGPAGAGLGIGLGSGDAGLADDMSAPVGGAGGDAAAGVNAAPPPGLVTANSIGELNAIGLRMALPTEGNVDGYYIVNDDAGNPRFAEMYFVVNDTHLVLRASSIPEVNASMLSGSERGFSDSFENPIQRGGDRAALTVDVSPVNTFRACWRWPEGTYVLTSGSGSIPRDAFTQIAMQLAQAG